MNEEAARQVLLVQAIETEDREQVLLTPDDRRFASRSARELARWQAAERRQADDFGQFLAQRAAQIMQRLGERHAGFGRVARTRLPWGALTLLLPLAALLAGFALDRLGDPHRVDLLSLPLLGIVAWNLGVFTVMALRTPWQRWRGPGGAPAPRATGWTSWRPHPPRKWPAPLTAAIARFAEQWTRLSAPLLRQRVARLWHLGAAAFATGAVGSLYVRGMLVEYRAGWESTFLDAQQLHALLGLLFAPALALLPLQGFSLQDVEALRWAGGDATAAPQAVAGGARWVHLYAATLGLLVVLPRLLLAAMAHGRTHRLAQDLAPDLGQPYYLRLRRAAGAQGGVLRVLPYSLRLDEARDRGLAALARQWLGDGARLALRPAIAYGEEPGPLLRELATGMTASTPPGSTGPGTSTADGSNPPAAGGVVLTAVLFNLAATPEPENHGALLTALRQALPRGVLVLVDASTLRERLGSDAVGTARLAERAALWESFCRFHHCEARIVDLLAPAAVAQDDGDPPQTLAAP